MYNFIFLSQNSNYSRCMLPTIHFCLLIQVSLRGSLRKYRSAPANRDLRNEGCLRSELDTLITAFHLDRLWKPIEYYHPNESLNV